MNYKSHRKQLSLFLFCTFFISSSLQATTIISFNINELLEKAEFVFEGEVIDVTTGMDDNDQWIVTDITFLVKDIIKGTDQGKTIKLRFVGGEYKGETISVAAMQYPRKGEKGIYFVESLTVYMLNPLLGWTQGHFLIREDNTVITAEGDVVKAIEANIVKEDPVSGGQAVGIVTDRTQKSKDKTQTAPTGMTSSEFKQQLLNMGWRK